MKTFMTLLVTAWCCMAGDKLTWREHEVAAVIIGEAGGEGFEGMRAVAAVIRNRARYHKVTSHREVSRRGSFTAYRHIWTYLKRLRTHKHRELALRLAKALRDNPDSLDSPVNGADHFDRKDVTPSWAKGRRPVKVIGNHKFYRLYGS